MITLPDSGVVTNQYWDTGELKKTFGARTYTVEYGYDAQGRLTNVLAGTGNTKWDYDSKRGFLVSSTFADGNGSTVSNSLSGTILKRTWARGVSASYGYNNAGDPISIDYSDSTPDVTYTLDRRGRRTSVSWGTNTLNLGYNSAGQMTNETWSSGIVSGISVISGYDSLLRRNSLQVTTNGSGLTTTTYGYDNASRLLAVTNGSDSVLYTYLANSSLLTNVLFKHGTTNVMTTTKVYDNLNRLTSISSVTSVSSVVVSSHTYLYNSANQRIKATLQDGSYWEYAYDSLGQVTNAVKKWSDNVLVAGQQFGYAYDSIGNRTSAKSGGDQNGLGLRSSTYTPNSLNQYTERTDPGSFDVLGTAQSNATVTVNNLATYRKSDYFWKELSVNNSSSAIYTNVSVVGVKNLVGTNQEDAVTTIAGSEFVPKTPEAYTYDLDGNLTGDGRWTYAWDGENRLTSVESLTNGPTASKRKVEWTYDYQGRKIRQSTSDGSSGSYVMSADVKSAYDGWQCLAELNATNNASLRSYVWGLDLSGTTYGAGGVGGLLLVASAANGAHFTAMDGNGNVVALLSTTAGAITASYEYSPLGQTLRATGSMAKENPYRFSTKPTEDTTQFIPYEFRTYRADNGRWTSRDSIGEGGGPNLYGFVNNNPVMLIDLLGKKVVVEPATAVDEVVDLFNFLSDLPSRKQGAEIKSCCDMVWVPQFPTAYECLCHAISSPDTYKIVVEAVGNKNWSLTYADGSTEMVQGPNTWPRTSGKTVYIPSKASVTYSLGLFDANGKYFGAPIWRILAHELCGHAVSGIGYPADQISGDRPGHDGTIDIENKIAIEHGATSRGKYADPKQGESAWRVTTGNSVYYKNKPRINALQATDYKLTLP